MIEYKKILFCTDFSEDANIAFLHALDLAKKYHASLHILHIPHSSYAYLRHVVDEHVPEGSEGGEAFFDEKIMKAAEGGYLSKIHQSLAKMKDSTPELSPFADKIKELADKFQFEQIIDLIQTSIKRGTER